MRARVYMHAYAWECSRSKLGVLFNYATFSFSFCFCACGCFVVGDGFCS